MKTRYQFWQTLVAGLLVVILARPLLADEYSYFPGAPTDQRTLQAQEMVEELYEAGDYRRSLLIYEKDLSPIGDKFAQYMVGYMYLHGQGVEANVPTALAWYRLAAERNDPAILQARDGLFGDATAEEIEASNQDYIRLWRQLGDNRLILELVREDMGILAQRTGSRLPGSNSSPITIVNVGSRTTTNGSYYDRVRKRMEMRLDYLDSNVEILDVDLGDDAAVTKSLEDEVKEDMAALDAR